MHCGAVSFGARCKRAAMGIKSLELRQQGRMDIEDSAAPAVDEPGCQQPHEAGKADRLTRRGPQRIVNGALECCAISAECSVIDDGCGNPGVARVAEPLGIWPFG